MRNFTPVKKAKKKATDEPLIRSSKDYAMLVMQHVSVSTKLKALEEEKKKLTATLKEHLDTYGKEDAQGNIVFTKTIGDVEVEARNSKRVTASLVPEADELLSRMGKKGFVEKQIVVREDLLQKAIEDGKFTARQVDKLYETSTNYALSTKVFKA